MKVQSSQGPDLDEHKTAATLKNKDVIQLTIERSLKVQVVVAKNRKKGRAA